MYDQWEIVLLLSTSKCLWLGDWENGRDGRENVLEAERKNKYV